MKKILLIALTFLSLNAFAKKEKVYRIKMETSMGTMVFRLYNETPLHRDNFLAKTKTHFFDSLLFHRVIKNFMIQGGDPESTHAKAGQALGNGEAPGSRIPAEFKTELYIHKKGALAAARDGNPEKASSNCQFYIVQGKTFTEDDLNKMEQRSGVKYTQEQKDLYKTIGGTPHLDNNYTVFGEVEQGMDVLDKIAAVQTAPGDRPLQDVRIIKCTIIKPKKRFLFF
jgi:peptidyl-prolyl cis-trans isomerase B (cyclophilin B)